MEERPESLMAETTKIKTGYGNLYVIIAEKDKRPFEIFAIMGKSGGSLTAKAEAIGRLCSLALRNGIVLDEIISQLEDIADDKPLFIGKKIVKSIPDALAIVLKNYKEKKEKENDSKEKGNKKG